VPSLELQVAFLTFVGVGCRGLAQLNVKYVIVYVPSVSILEPFVADVLRLTVSLQDKDDTGHSLLY
jgi:hypothetical protein